VVLLECDFPSFRTERGKDGAPGDLSSFRTGRRKDGAPEEAWDRRDVREGELFLVAALIFFEEGAAGWRASRVEFEASWRSG